MSVGRKKRTTLAMLDCHRGAGERLPAIVQLQKFCDPVRDRRLTRAAHESNDLKACAVIPRHVC